MRTKERSLHVILHETFYFFSSYTLLRELLTVSLAFNFFFSSTFVFFLLSFQETLVLHSRAAQNSHMQCNRLTLHPLSRFLLLIFFGAKKIRENKKKRTPTATFSLKHFITFISNCFYFFYNSSCTTCLRICKKTEIEREGK